MIRTPSPTIPAFDTAQPGADQLSGGSAATSRQSVLARITADGPAEGLRNCLPNDYDSGGFGASGRTHAILTPMKRLLLLLATAATLLAADITGTWEFNVETDMGSGTPIFKFKQDGNKLTGDYSGQLGTAPITGTVEGDKVEFTFEVSPGGDKLLIKYAGTLEGDNKIKGTVDLGGQAKGTFTGTKK